MDTSVYCDKSIAFPFFENGWFSSKKYMEYKRNPDPSSYVFDSRTEEGSLRHISRVGSKGLVFNRLQRTSVASKSKNADLLIHKNVEPILWKFRDDHFQHWITPLFVTKLRTVWEEQSAFILHDVKKIFSDLLSGLKYLRNNNFVHTTIHEDNLAFNGKDWYISGTLQPQKDGERASGQYCSASIKSRRMLTTRNPTPESSDDLWQLILMYVITYYGFNPFHPNAHVGQVRTIGAHHSLDDDKIKMNISKGFCRDIKTDKTESQFGQVLKKMLLHLETGFHKIDCYDEFQKIIDANTDLSFKQIVNRVVSKLQPEEVCIICLDLPVELEFHPCGHAICCKRCSNIWKSHNNTCPMCRSPIRNNVYYKN